MLVGEIIYEEDEYGKEIKSNLENFMQVEGVWALYGKEKEGFDYICLNVGKSKNIGEEVLFDIGCLHFLKIRKDGTEEYRNQFDEPCDFKYKSKQTQEYLYPIIASSYNSLKFVYEYEKSCREKECELAIKNHAIFWRDSRPFGVMNKMNISNPRIQLMGELFANGGEHYSLEELLTEIENRLGYDKRSGKRLITECEKNGFIYKISDGFYTR